VDLRRDTEIKLAKVEVLNHLNEVNISPAKICDKLGNCLTKVVVFNSKKKKLCHEILEKTLFCKLLMVKTKI
jgi:hypothetical protein